MLIQLLLLVTAIGEVYLQQDDVYRGKFLNKFNTYHTQILGEVYIVDMYTIFIKGFTYDGKSRDAYFMVGSSLRPNNEGKVIANEEGKTNVLTQYINRDLTLKLPQKVTTISWLAIYDLLKLKTLADVSIPEGFEPPKTQTIKPIAGLSHGVSSDPVRIIDSKTIRISKFNYDGTGKVLINLTETEKGSIFHYGDSQHQHGTIGCVCVGVDHSPTNISFFWNKQRYNESTLKVYFWIGKGSEPNEQGRKIPDENGYLSPLHAYTQATVVLELPGNVTITENDWLAIWDVESQLSYGSVSFPKDMNIPPALIHIFPHENRLPNCEQLHKHLQVSWEVFGPQITIELAGMIDENDYMAFGISGSTERTQMNDADVAVVYIDSWQGLTVDYNVAEKAPCTKTVDTYRGTCPDLKVAGLDDYQFIMHERKNNVTIINYRRNLISPDPKDKNFTETDMYVVWAVGHLSVKKEPLFHYLYPKGNVKINFNRKQATKNCYYFTTRMKTLDTIERDTWTPTIIKEESTVNFSASLGPSGGPMGYEHFTGQSSQQLAWYINGLLAPEIYVKRYEKYIFKIEGGNDIHSPLYNNPFYISNDPEGGHDRLTSDEQRRVRIYAGVNFDRREDPIPFAAGRLCRWENRNVDLRLLDQFSSFAEFRRQLRYSCDTGNPGVLEWIPNKTTPNVVYYQSYKQPYMGWKIHVLDEFPTGSSGKLQTNGQILSLLLYFSMLLFLTKIT